MLKDPSIFFLSLSVYKYRASLQIILAIYSMNGLTWLNLMLTLSVCFGLLTCVLEVKAVPEARKRDQENTPALARLMIMVD